MGGFLAVAMVAVVAWLAWRGARKRYEEARAALHKRTRTDRTPAVTLEKDPKSGVYRPRE